MENVIAYLIIQGKKDKATAFKIVQKERSESEEHASAQLVIR